VKLRWAKHTAQKTRREVEEKIKEEAERQRVVEEKEERKWRMVEYPQQLQDKVIAEGTEGSQITGSKYREVLQRMMQTAGLPKKLKENNQQDIEETWELSWEELIPVKDVCILGRTAWCTIQGK